MQICSTKTRILPPGRRGSWRQINILIIVFLIACLLSGCASSKQLYENPELGIKLIKSENWDVKYYERSGSIVLETKGGIGNSISARIEINGNACFPVPAWFNGSREAIELNIDRIRILYSLDSITIVQEPIEIENRGNEVVKAIIAIPTMSMPENDVRNQIGDRNPNLLQRIELFAIKDKDYFVMAYIYEGDGEALNAEAEEIVASIQLSCSP